VKVRLTLEDPTTGAAEIVETTPEHLFYVPGLGFVEAAALTPGDPVSRAPLADPPSVSVVRLINLNDTSDALRVKALTLEFQPFWAYNLEVADYHTFFVGTDRAWVHNAKCNLNSNEAVSEFGVYEIEVEGEVLLGKVGKADLERVTKLSGLPTRLHQQVRKLEKKFGVGKVVGRVVEKLGRITTRQAKGAETARLDKIFKETGKIPEGNLKSFKPPPR